MRSCFFSRKVLPVLWVLFFSIAALPGCKKIAKEVFSGFDLTLVNIPSVIPPIPISDYTYSVPATWPFNLDSIVKANTRGAFGGKDITSVRVNQATVRLQNADSATNLSHWRSVSISLYSDNNTTPLTVVTAAVPDTATHTLAFNTGNSPELLPYLQGTTLTYVFTVVTRRPMRHSLVAFTDIVLTIK